MISVFNLEKLKALLQDFYRLTNIRTAIFDSERRELISWPEQRPTFCALIRSQESGRAACAACDRRACDTALKTDGTYIYRCHAGLTEAIVPLHADKALVGFLIFGHVFAYGSPEEGWREVSIRCEKYGVATELLRAACDQMPLFDQEYIQSATHILHATASFLLLEKMAALKEDTAARRLDLWLSRHYAEKITAASACQSLGIGRTRLYKLCQQLYGCGIGEQIKKLRMEKARQLLQEKPGMTIAEVAAACGFPDYNYFIAVFSQSVGMPPRAFRQRHAS